MKSKEQKLFEDAPVGRAVLSLVIPTVISQLITGMSQGALPLIGYNYSSQNYKRMLAAIKTDFLMSPGISVVGTLFLFTCAGPIVHAFIDNAETVRYGQTFQRIICITGPAFP